MINCYFFIEVVVFTYLGLAVAPATWYNMDNYKERENVRREKKMLFETCYYIVDSIDGDYANLLKLDSDQTETKLVARALLQEAIVVGSKLKYEMLQYELV